MVDNDPCLGEIFAMIWFFVGGGDGVGGGGGRDVACNVSTSEPLATSPSEPLATSPSEPLELLMNKNLNQIKYLLRFNFLEQNPFGSKYFTFFDLIV